MRILLKTILLFLPFTVFCQSPICTNGFTLAKDGQTCWKFFPTPANPSSAARTCGLYGATLATITDSNENQLFSRFVTGIDDSVKRVWIGLSCIENDPLRCYWDDETGNANFSSFAIGSPNTDIGSCVYYSTSGINMVGKWASSNCGDTVYPFICQMPTTFPDEHCNHNFNGNCFLISDELSLKVTNFTEAKKACEKNCAVMASIHNAYENLYINQLLSVHTAWSGYLGGVRTSGDEFEWIDGTPVDYNRMDQGYAGADGCLMNQYRTYSAHPSGSWWFWSCSAIQHYICKRPAGTKCSSSSSSSFSPSRTKINPPNPIPQQTSDCNAVMYDHGVITSPINPYASDNNLKCSYKLVTSNQNRVYLRFKNFSADPEHDSLTIYDGDSTESPIIATFNTSQNLPMVHISTGNQMYLTFSTDANVAQSGFTAFFLTKNVERPS